MHLSFLPLLVILLLHETSAASIKDQLDHPNDEKAANETKITQTENQCISKRFKLDSENILRTLLPHDLMAFIVLISFSVFTISYFGRIIWNCFNWCIFRKFKKLSEKQKLIDKIKKQENKRFDVNNVTNGLIVALYFLLIRASNKDSCFTDWSKLDTISSEFLVGGFPSKFKIEIR